MDTFDKVTIVKKANIYFDGKVTSRTVLLQDGSKKSLGVMLPGEYEFATAEKELMEILTGKLTVLLPHKTDWETFSEGESFEVEANNRFKLIVREVTDYCCTYISA